MNSQKAINPNTRTIKGIGIITDDVAPFINANKLIDIVGGKILSVIIPEEEAKSYKTVPHKPCEKYLTNKPGIKRLLSHTYTDSLANLLSWYFWGTLVSDVDDDDKHYLYYPSSMPFTKANTPNRSLPKSASEVHEWIANLLKEITSLSDDAIEDMIDDELCVVCHNEYY